MAKAKSQSASSSAVAEPPRPTYAAPPAAVLDGAPAFAQASDAQSELLDIINNASYSLLDKRDGRWSLLTFGGAKSGCILKVFDGFEHGVEFIRDLGIKNCRCLALPEGVVR